MPSFKGRPWTYAASGLAFSAVVAGLVWYPYFRGQKVNPGQRHVLEWQAIVQGHAWFLVSLLSLIVVLGFLASWRPAFRRWFAMSPFVFGVAANLWTFRDLDAAEYVPLTRLPEPTMKNMAGKVTEQWVIGTRYMYESLRGIYEGGTLVSKSKVLFVPWMLRAVAGMNLVYEDYENKLSREAFDELLTRYEIMPYGSTVFLYDPKVDPRGQKFYVLQHEWIYVTVPERERALAKGSY